MNSPLTATLLAAAIAVAVSGCAPSHPKPEPLRAVRAVEIRYDQAHETNRYVGSVQSRHEVDQAFRVGGKVVARKVDVGQTVKEGDVLADLDATDYRLAFDAAQQQLIATQTHARQAASDRERLARLKADGSVSVADDEHATSGAETADAAAEADARKLELAMNRLKYTALRASQSGVVTAVKFEVGQVVAEGQPVVSIANQSEPEIVVDVPEDHLAAFRSARFKASLASAPDAGFDVVLRELSPQAAPQTRTYRARLKPLDARQLPLGATATLVAQRESSDASVAVIPASAITQKNGQPAAWIVHRGSEEGTGTVELVAIGLRGYRNEEALVSGVPAGNLVVVAGVQKMAPGLRVALSDNPKMAAQTATTAEGGR